MNILIADDHKLFLDILQAYIKAVCPDAVIYTAKDFNIAYNSIRTGDHDFDIVLLDLMMPGMDGLNSVQILRNELPDTKIVIISGLAKQYHVEELMGIGIDGYIPKTLSAQSVIKAIKLILSGETFLPYDRKTNAIKASYITDAQHDFSYPVLSGQEKNVLLQLKGGQNNTFIADKLNMHISSVKLHMRNLCRKFGVDNRTQVLLKAQDLGLV